MAHNIRGEVFPVRSKPAGPIQRIKIDIDWQHKGTGVNFTKRLYVGEIIPSFPRRNIIACRMV